MKAHKNMPIEYNGKWSKVVLESGNKTQPDKSMNGINSSNDVQMSQPDLPDKGSRDHADPIQKRPFNPLTIKG
jgi:hypothetical protein